MEGGGGNSTGKGPCKVGSSEKIIGKTCGVGRGNKSRGLRKESSTSIGDLIKGEKAMKNERKGKASMCGGFKKLSKNISFVNLGPG